jgi:hypothetical protein
MLKKWRKFAAIVKGLVMELTDQSAYQRHLLAHGVSHSPAEWRRFSDKKWEAGSKKAKCC